MRIRVALPGNYVPQVVRHYSDDFGRDEDAMPEIYVSAPMFWWRAPVARVRTWVFEDPDAADGTRRWQDRDEQRWDLIAEAVSVVSDALGTRSWTPDEELGFEGQGIVDVNLTALASTEQEIVQSWFTIDEAVRFDPWFVPLTNGRHRLWSTLQHFGDRLVPIAGDALGYADRANVEALGEGWPRLFQANLDELASVSWFNRSDPVNQRFVASLEAAARGEIPPPV